MSHFIGHFGVSPIFEKTNKYFYFKWTLPCWCVHGAKCAKYVQHGASSPAARGLLVSFWCVVQLLADSQNATLGGQGQSGRHLGPRSCWLLGRATSTGCGMAKRQPLWCWRSPWLYCDLREERDGRCSMVQSAEGWIPRLNQTETFKSTVSACVDRVKFTGWSWVEKTQYSIPSPFQK